MSAWFRAQGPSTRKIYLGYARLFAKYHMRSPAEMGEDQIRPIGSFERALVDGRLDAGRKCAGALSLP